MIYSLRLLVIAIGLLGAPAIADDLPQATSDGLVRVQDPKVMIAYVRPNTDWAKYKTVLIQPLVIPQSARNTAPKGQRPEFGETYKLSNDDVATIQKAYQDETRKQLTKAGYTVVDTPQADTLVVSPQVINITLNAPLDSAGMDGPGVTFTQGAGSMAMQAQLADGTSGTTVAVAADRKYSHQMWGIDNTVENMSEARSAFGSWARELASAIKDRAAAPK